MSASIVSTFVLAFGATCLFVWMLIPVGVRVGLVDRPGGRKNHHGELPTIGGVAITAAVISTALILDTAARVHPAFWTGLMVIALIGTLDDLRDLGYHSKFLAQIAATALMLFWAGWYVDSVGHLLGPWELGLGKYSIAVTFIAVVGVINAVNFTDGADGLAGGLVFNALLWYCVLGLSAPAPPGEVQIALALLAAVGAFLMFNLRLPGRARALVFLGDAGSLGLGFAVAWFMVTGAQRAAPLYAPVTAVWLIAVPLVDTLTCTGRRLMCGTSPFKADSKHLHHVIIGLGLPAGMAVALIHACAFLLGGIGVAGWYWRVAEYVMFYAAMAIYAAYLVFYAWALRRIHGQRK
ncbi:MAG: hypothetical protein A3G25_20835 [Betaproteobacteria bacterium RIFCSPLOWO2_12_FULL_63_13]|nr:MAG: hypothetical protein A3G25_20835 [Betaproteobacteria bacterium RIFCSPLOWO2_12_FULL_63_13]